MGNCQNSLRVAVIDDEEPVRLALLALLEAQGHEAALFESAEEFLASDQRQGYACILLDLWLKNRMNGLEFLRNFPAASHVAPVVMMTRQADVKSAVEAGQLGVMDYLPKPILPTQLHEVLNKARQAPPPPRPAPPAEPLPVKLPKLLAWFKTLEQDEWQALLREADGGLSPERMRQIRALTQREAQVWGRVVDGGPTNKEIGKDLHIGDRAVEAHYNSLREKLGIQGSNARAAVLDLRDILLLELLNAAGRLS